MATKRGDLFPIFIHWRMQRKPCCEFANALAFYYHPTVKKRNSQVNISFPGTRKDQTQRNIVVANSHANQSVHLGSLPSLPENYKLKVGFAPIMHYNNETHQFRIFTWLFDVSRPLISVEGEMPLPMPVRTIFYSFWNGFIENQQLFIATCMKRIMRVLRQYAQNAFTKHMFICLH